MVEIFKLRMFEFKVFMWKSYYLI